MSTRPKAIPMKKCKPQSKAKNFDYPDQTEGGKLAQQIRSDANNLKEGERSELFQRGMQVIYGGSGNKNKVRPGH